MTSNKQRWFIPLLHALPLILLIGGLYFYWFALVDRFVIFLYGHLGATTFDSMTTGRYWMTGLVVGGIVMVLYTAIHVVISNISPHYVPPPWWQVWFWAALPLIIIIPAIVMNVNHPTLPADIAGMITAVAILALALALPPAAIVTHSLAQFGWLMLAGLGIMPSILLLRVIELPQQGLINPTVAYIIGIGSTIIGIIWGFLIGWIYVRRQQTHWTTFQLITSSLQISYLLLPLVHHLLMTPPRYRYISSTQNFFATNPLLQITVWGIAFLVCISIVAFQKKWSAIYV